MTFNYNEVSKMPMSIVLANGLQVQGEFIDLRIAVETLPKGKEWYQICHADDDDLFPASLKRGCVVVNFFGTLICEPIKELKDGDEVEIKEWDW